MQDPGRHPPIVLNTFTRLRRQLDRVLNDAKMTLRLAAEVDTGRSACQALAQCVDISVVDRLWLDAMPPGLPEFRPWDPGVMASFGLIHPPSLPLGTSARLLAGMLREIFRAPYKASHKERCVR